MATFTEDEAELEPARVKELLDAGEVELVDVRENYEWDAGHAPGARHVELADVSGQAESIGVERPVVFTCRVGSRSAMATQAFRGAGREAFNLTGGMVAWVDAGLPLEPGDGEVALH